MSMAFAADGSGDDSDWAHRRTLKACKLCRKKKVRCDGVQPTCAQCRTHRSKCIYLPRATRARPRIQQRDALSGAAGTTHVSPQMTSQPPAGNATSSAHSPRASDPSPTPGSSLERTTSAVQEASHNHPTINNTDGLGADILQLLNYPRLDFPTPLGGEQHLANGHQEQGFSGHCAFMEDITQGFGDVSGSLIPQTLPTDPLPSTLPEAQAIFSSHGLADEVLKAGQGFAGVPPDQWSPNSDYHFSASFGDADFAAVRVDSRAEIHHESGMHEDWESTMLEEDAGHSLQITSCGHVKYMGPSMSFLPATRIGQEWISHVTGSTYFSDQLQDFLNKFTPSDLENIAPDERYNESYLPPQETAVLFVDAYFSAVQSALPILDQPSFVHNFYRTYQSLSASKDPTWCAMVNVVLAIGCRAMPNSSEKLVCGLFGNALSLFSRVVLGLSDLRKVQTLTLMYTFLSHTTSPHWGYTMLSTAVREAHAIGLHLQPFKSWRLSKPELRQRSLVFWTLFCLDINLCFRLARPPMIKRSEIFLETPVSAFEDAVAAHQPSIPHCNEAFGPQQLLLFKKNIQSSYLLHDVYEITTAKADIGFLEQRVPELEQEITHFTSSLNSAWRFSAETVMQQAASLQRDILLPVSMLNCTIFIAKWILRLRLLTLKTAQKLRAGLDELPGEPSPSLANDIARSSAAAGSMIQMAQALASDQPNMHWYFAPLCVYAFYVLFLAILHEPLGSQSGEYMELMSVVVEGTVQSVSTTHPLIADKHLTHFLAFFARTARMAITQARNEKRKGLRL